jgi:hypothetical protein
VENDGAERQGRRWNQTFPPLCFFASAVSYAQPYFKRPDTWCQTPGLRNRHGHVTQQEKPEEQPGQEAWKPFQHLHQATTKTTVADPSVAVLASPAVISRGGISHTERADRPSTNSR